MSIANTMQDLARFFGLNVHRWPSERHLIVEYPVLAESRYGYKTIPHPAILAIIEAKRGVMREHLHIITQQDGVRARIPKLSPDLKPHWDNSWFPPLDASFLMHFLIQNRPKRFVEIGSGMSTIFARHAINFADLDTRITSIDPQPRKGIDGLCDEVVRVGLEEIDLSFFDKLEAGDILFFDGSHVTFADTDVTVFFLEVLPRLAPGIFVQIHDIFWPYDYPPEWRTRYYSEQYMLGIALLYGKYETIFASAFVSRDDELAPMARKLIDGDSMYGQYLGTSYWLKS